MSDRLGPDAARLRRLGINSVAVERAAFMLAAALQGGRKVLVFGNGGSAADAQHLAAELVGRFEMERPALPAIALTTDSSALTAIANDFGFDRLFSRQVEALGQRGDVAIGISTSGASSNVLAGVRTARAEGLATVGLCGAPACQLCHLVDVAISLPADGAAAAQEGHVVVIHALCRALERLLFGSSSAEFSPAPPGSVVSMEQLLTMRAGWRAGARTVVWTNGCFDVLHAGHLASLEAARSFGDVLVVGVNSDRAVEKLKGPGRPIVPEVDRAAMLAALRPVDYVVVFDDATPEVILEKLRPEIHTKGADYTGPSAKAIPERAIVEGYGGRVEFLPMLPERSTTDLVRKIQDGEAGK